MDFLQRGDDRGHLVIVEGGQDIPFDIIDKINIKINHDNIFLTLKQELTNLEMMNLIENSIIVYK